jgi:hypothetical protein
VFFNKIALPNTFLIVPDLAFADMRFLNRLDDNIVKRKTQLDTKHREEEDEENDVSAFFPSHQDAIAQTKKNQGAIAGKESLDRSRAILTDTRSTNKKGVMESEDHILSCSELATATAASDRPSSSYYTWPKCSSIQSSRAASFPKAPESVQIAAFQFKPGPFRSSSVGILENLVNSTIQKSQPMKRVRSDGDNYKTLHLSGGSPRTSYQQAVLSSEGAQHGDKRPHQFHSGAKNRIIESHRNAQFLPSGNSEEPSVLSYQENVTRSASSRNIATMASQQSMQFPGRTDCFNQPESLNSLSRMLSRCKHAQRQATQRVSFADADSVIEPLIGTKYAGPLDLYSGPSPSDENVFNEQGLHGVSQGSEPAYHQHMVVVEAHDDGELEFDTHINGQYVEVPELAVWDTGIDDGDVLEEFEEDVFRMEDRGGVFQGNDFVDNLKIKSIDRRRSPAITILAQRRREIEGPLGRKWRPNKLY